MGISRLLSQRAAAAPDRRAAADAAARGQEERQAERKREAEGKEADQHELDESVRGAVRGGLRELLPRQQRRVPVPHRPPRCQAQVAELRRLRRALHLAGVLPERGRPLEPGLQEELGRRVSGAGGAGR